MSMRWLALMLLLALPAAAQEGNSAGKAGGENAANGPDRDKARADALRQRADALEKEGRKDEARGPRSARGRRGSRAGRSRGKPRPPRRTAPPRTAASPGAYASRG